MHELVTTAASGEVQAAGVTLNELIDRWLGLGGPPRPRPGSLQGLHPQPRRRWADVGWDTGEIIVRRRVSRTESAPVLVDLTKTHKTRTAPVDQGTLEALRRFHASLVERSRSPSQRIGDTG